MKKLLFIIWACLSILKLNAQSMCATDEYDAYLKRINPTYADERKKMEQEIYSIVKNKQTNPNARIMQNDCQQGVFTIPVVVHIIHKGEAIGTGTNITDAQVIDAIKGMNEKWRKITGDGVDLEVEFALAVRDTNNSTTNGITRYDGRVFPRYMENGIYYSNNTTGANQDTIVNNTVWDRSRYINIWIADIRGAGGWASLSGNYTFFASYNISSYTLAHEMGHTFSLYHTFNGDGSSLSSSTQCPTNNDCLLDGDRVCDTPPHRVENCNTTSCTSSGDLQNSFKNYMSYCGSTTRFTQGQKERVRAALFNGFERLIYSPALIPINTALEVGIESIENNFSYPICNNFIPNIKIHNSGLNTITTLKITTYIDNVLFDAKAFNTNLIKNTTLVYNLNPVNFTTQGQHNLKFVVNEINGSTSDFQPLNNQICKDILVRNNPITLCNDFENGDTNGFISTGTLIKPIITNVNGCIKNGTKALTYNVFNNPNLNSQSNDKLYFSFSLDSVASAYITYDHAYKKSKTNGYLFMNSFIVDCEGQSTYLNSINEDVLASVSGRDSINPFIPTSCTQWKTDSLNITGFQGQNNLLLQLYIAFSFPISLDTTHKCLQNLYFDNICLHKRYIIYTNTSPSGNGYVTYTGGNVVYDEGGTATLIATPYYCKAFKNWTENGVIVSTNPTYTFTVTRNRNLVANFEPKKVNITSSAFPINAGVTFGDGQYLCDSSFNLKARANLDYTFYNWTDTSGNVYSNDSILNGYSNVDKKFIANFKILVKANAANANLGYVYGTGYYNYNDSARVAAYSNNSCYQFKNWTENGIEVSTSSIYKFRVTRNINLVANFIRTSYVLSLSSNPSGGGTFNGIGTYPCDTFIQINATPASCYTFSKWTENGSTVSTNASYSFTVSSNRNLVANFTKNRYIISLSPNDASKGTVTGNGNYGCDTTVTIKAKIKTGAVWQNWTENGNIVSIDSVYSFTASANRTLVANFTTATYSVSISSNIANAGILTGGGTIPYGTITNVQATPASCYTFTKWTENGNTVSTNANYSFTVNSNRNLVANFELKRYNITLAANPTNGGTVSNAGNFACDSLVTVKSSIKTGYKFLNWMEGSTIVSTDSNYTFLISGARSLKANFGLATGIKQTTLNEISKIYPNPANDILQLEIHSKQNSTLTLNIIDMKGSLFETKTINNTKGTFNTTLDVSKLAKGNYILNLYDEEGMANYKFVVQ